jgi:aspartate aminotransferase
MRDAYRARRDAAVDVAADRGIPFVTPQGAFYLWLDVSATGVTAREFALSLIRERGVAVAPGTAFGAEGEGWIRISLANSRDAVVGGVDAVAALMSQTSAQVQ